MLEIKNMTIKYSLQSVLDKVCIKVNIGDKIIVTGPSGSGKSTLLRAILFFEPFTGQILWQNKQVNSTNLSDFRASTGYIGQKAPQMQGLVRDFLKFPFEFRRNAGLIWDEERVQTMCKQLQLDFQILNQPYNKLSGGEQQRMNIIQALMLKRPLYLLDEVTSGLDNDNIERSIDLLAEDEQQSLLVVAHNPQWLNRGFKHFHLENGCLEER